VSAIDYAGLSDIGCERSSNQDRWGADAELGLFLVADGVAGSSDGELAAQVVAELLPTYLRRHLDGEAEPSQLGRAVAELSNDLYLTGQTDTRVAGATSTVVAVVVAGSRALVAHMGDSRVYLYREQQLQQLTHDHSLVQALIDSHEIKPEEAAQHPARNVVIRFVGMPPPALPDAVEVELRDGDRILLCSDGLYGVVDDAALAGIVGAESMPEDACAALIAAARQAGGPDNITAVVVHIAGQ
jgi:PPM family protein phosphatase